MQHSTPVGAHRIKLVLYDDGHRGSVYAPVVSTLPNWTAEKGNASLRFFKAIDSTANFGTMAFADLIDEQLIVAPPDSTGQQPSLILLDAIDERGKLIESSLQQVANHYAKTSLNAKTFVEAMATMLVHVHGSPETAKNAITEVFQTLYQTRPKGSDKSALKTIVDKIVAALGRQLKEGSMEKRRRK